MSATSDNPIARWAIYNLAWWIIKRRIRRNRRRFIAAGVIGLVVVVGLFASRK